jgi:hypothetical protein
MTTSGAQCPFLSAILRRRPCPVSCPTNGVSNVNIEALTAFQKDQLLHFFFHTMPMEQRQRLMATLPQAYNAACERKIVAVIHCTFNEDITAQGERK